MKITKNDRIIVETTNMINGMLEQGGICGRRVSYPLAAVIEATGMSREELEKAGVNDQCDNSKWVVSIREMIENCCHGCGKVVRRGHRIH